MDYEKRLFENMISSIYVDKLLKHLCYLLIWNIKLKIELSKLLDVIYEVIDFTNSTEIFFSAQVQESDIFRIENGAEK